MVLTVVGEIIYMLVQDHVLIQVKRVYLTLLEIYIWIVLMERIFMYLNYYSYGSILMNRDSPTQFFNQV